VVITSSTAKSKPTLKDALRAVEASNMVALDIETTGLDPRSSEVRLIQVSDGAETFVIDCRRVDPTKILEILADKTVVAHGAAFEWMFVYHRFGVELKAVRDTLLMAQILACGDMSVKSGLGAVSERYLNLELDKEMQTADWSLETLTERHLEYAAADARVLLPLHAKLQGEISRLGLERVAALENAAVPAVARMKLEGMPVDKAAWAAHAGEVEAELKALKNEMLEADWMSARDPEPQEWRLHGPDCKEMLEKTLGTEIAGTTAKDLKPLAEDHAIVEKLLAYRKAKGKDREDLKSVVLEHAAKKPPKPAPPWNFGSPDQVHDIVFEILGFDIPRTDEATLLRYANSHPFFKKLLEYRRLSKRVSTYGPGWFKDAYDDALGRVFPDWRQIGTSTGRFSCSSPNAQQVPNDGPYRSFFGAPAGRAFVDVDYSQIEVRVYAKIVEETALLDLFERDADVYTSTAATLIGITEDEVTKEQRQKAKAIMLGLLYGLSAAGLPTYAFKNYGVVITPPEAEKLIEGFFGIYPAIAADHDEVLAELSAEGRVDQKTLAGRRRDGITNRNEAINAPIQGSAADGMKMAMALVHDRLRKFEGTAFVIAALHDELLIECDEADACEIETIVKEAMIEAMNDLVNATEPKVAIKVSGGVTKVWTKD
jgi:DNA polymerase I-like protein with 3'-5' exonuclease and polymerase domains